MFRESEYQDEKKENRDKILKLKESPNSYLDVLSIIEHPAFMEFYDRELEGDYGVDENEPKEGHSTGDIVKVSLKENYKKYDLYFIDILQEANEEIEIDDIDIYRLEPLTSYSLEKLKSFTPKGEIFYSEEMTLRTQFGTYNVDVNIFNATHYQEYLQKLMDIVLNKKQTIKNRTKKLPILQIYQSKIIQFIDMYIRIKLFNQFFDPMEEINFKVLLNRVVTEHIIKVFSKVIYDIQLNNKQIPAVIKKNYFSSLKEFNYRKNYLLNLTKTIYTQTPYPTNKGNFEKEFLKFLDRDSKVLKFIKIMEFKHQFAKIKYFRSDGLIASYYPDFLVESDKDFLIIETKANKDIQNQNVLNKQKATIDYVNMINNLDENLRDNKTWKYLLLSDDDFYSLSKNGADIEDIIKNCEFNEMIVRDRLF